jgi:hypothetical protein
LGRLPWFALLRRARIRRFFVFFDMPTKTLADPDAYLSDARRR